MRNLSAVLALSLLASAFFVMSADAQRRRRQRQARQQAAPHSAHIAEAMGDIRWGMSKDQLLGYFTKRIREQYSERIAKARDSITEDQLRHEQTSRIRRVRESYIEFTGQTTGWDVSHLRYEFTHDNQEAMLLIQDRSAQNYYFFIRGRLWKWYRAFNADVFGGYTFDQFTEALQGRYGQARAHQNEAIFQGGEARNWLEWQDANTRLRAVDENRFYGFYCLVFEEKETLGQLAQLRTTPDRRGRQERHALVEAVTQGNDQPVEDSNADIADRITGNIRRRQDAPEQSATPAPGGGGQQPPRTTTTTPVRPPAGERAPTGERAPGVNDDPLQGLEDF